MSKETILVTGANGVLGSAFRDIANNHAEYEWYFTTSKNMNLLDWEDVIQRLLYHKFDYIIHTAALSGGNLIAKKHPAKLLHDNVMMDLNIMEAARLSGVKKVIMTLSGGLYPPNMSGKPTREGMIHTSAPHPSNYSYAHAKRLIEPMIRAYREEYGLNAIGLVPDAIYGPNDYFGEDGNMTASLISKFFRAMCRGTDVEIWGDGSQWRQLTYSKDLARVYMWALQNYDSPDILNVSTDELTQVKGLVDILSEMFGIGEERVKYDTSKPTGPGIKALDNSKFLALSDFHYTPLAEGLQETVDWYVNQKPEDLRTGSKVRS